MAREDLIDGAVTFLQDPSVSTAPLEQKISFLRSKNLTQDEIDASLARVGLAPSAQSAPQQSSVYAAQQYRPPPQQYGGYQQQPYWGQPPPELPRRDWRDWFIMATVVGGVGYGMYWTARRYIYPLIAPPTPPQLEQDKASIDASFDKAFALLDQLATDTQELKDSEKERKERLDHALAEVESVISKMKESNENRELEAKRMVKEIEEIKDSIPKAIQKEKETTDGRLKDLATEMKSLKALVGNRVGGAPTARASPSSFSTSTVNGTSSTATPSPNPATATEPSGTHTTSTIPEPMNPLTSTDHYAPPKDRSTYLGSRSTPGTAGKAQIPAWQLAAKRKTEEAKESASASSTPTTDSRPNSWMGGPTNEKVNGEVKKEVQESGTVKEVEVEAESNLAEAGA